jgi:hypothetical protein
MAGNADVRVNDVVQMRKAHPCGSDRWQVYRIGADIGLRCQGCGRRVMLTRREFNKALRRLIGPAAPAPEEEDAG